MADKVTFRAVPDAKRRIGSMSTKAMQHLGPRIVEVAERLAPVDTGELKSSIDYVIRDEAGLPHLYIAAGLRSRAPYAGFVELGTRRMRAQPYLRPAAFRRWL